MDRRDFLTTLTADVVQDAYEMFGNPRFIHLGYEEEFNDRHARTDEM